MASGFFSRIVTEGSLFIGSGIDLTFDYSPSAAERVARNLQGRFTSAQAEVRAEFEGLAIRLQEMQVEALHTAMETMSREGLREQRGTHYLEDAIMSPDNRTITTDGFVVGNAAAFDESRAGPYWRGLEEGSSKHIGQQMYGLWITPGGFAAPDGWIDVKGRYGSARDAIGFTGWRNIPASIREDYRDSETGKLPGFRIHEPIPAYGYLQKGVEDFMASGAVPEALQRALQRALGIQSEAAERGVSTRQVRAEHRAAAVSTAFQ